MLLYIDSSFLQKVVYAVLDISLLVVGISLTGKIAARERNFSGPLIIAILLVSVFFWQHVATLNYNLIATFGLILAFYGISRKSPLVGLVGIIITGLKPSLAIPALLYLLISKNWKLLCYSVLTYGVVLLYTSIRIDTSPIDIVSQLKDTQSRFSNGYSDGFFFFLKVFLGDQMTTLGGTVSLLVIAWLRKSLLDPINGLIVVIVLGLSLFYNNVHAWIIVYPLLVYGIVEAFARRMSPIPCVLLLIFILVPRLAGIFNQEAMGTYVAVHNIVRFGLLFVAAYFLIRNRADRRSQVVNELSPAEHLK